MLLATTLFHSLKYHLKKKSFNIYDSMNTFIKNINDEATGYPAALAAI